MEKRAIYISFVLLAGLLPACEKNLKVDTTEVAVVEESTSFTDFTPSNSIEEDREILIEFYNQMGGRNWTQNLNWCSEKPLHLWYGVLTDANGRVKVLELTDNHLVGSFPESFRRLSTLHYLWLPQNRISGSIEGLNQMPLLTHLCLTGNDLSGELPEDWSMMSSLRALKLDNNKFVGSLPASIGELPKLRYLTIEQNYLTGLIPDSFVKVMERAAEYSSPFCLSRNYLYQIPEAIKRCASFKLYANNITIQRQAGFN